MSIDRTPPSVPDADGKDTGPDPYGMAALLLAESLIHRLCENTIISTIDAVNIVDRAANVQHERATNAPHGSASMWHSHEMMVNISKSLRTDLEFAPFTPKLVT